MPALVHGGRTRPTSSVAVNPEFMREGSSLRDFAQPPMTLVGCARPARPPCCRTLYTGVEAPFVHTTVRTAEMAKYVSNAFHALKVSFANEIGDLCEALGADAQEVMRVFAMDRKLNISEAYLRPGFAFGGSCLPKDVRALLHAARAADLSVPLLVEILPSNDAQIQQGVDAVLATRRRRIGVVGLAFKPGTDDLRESPMVTPGREPDRQGLRRAHPRPERVDRPARRREPPLHRGRDPAHRLAHVRRAWRPLLAHAEVLVVGNAGEDARRGLASARPDQVVIDLTRSVGRSR